MHREAAGEVIDGNGQLVRRYIPNAVISVALMAALTDYRLVVRDGELRPLRRV